MNLLAILLIGLLTMSNYIERNGKYYKVMRGVEIPVSDREVAEKLKREIGEASTGTSTSKREGPFEIKTPSDKTIELLNRRRAAPDPEFLEIQNKKFQELQRDKKQTEPEDEVISTPPAISKTRENVIAAGESPEPVDRYAKMIELQQNLLNQTEKAINEANAEEEANYTEAKKQKKVLRIAQLIDNLAKVAISLSAAHKGVGRSGAQIEMAGFDASDDIAEINEDLRQRQSILRSKVKELQGLRETKFGFDAGIETRRIGDTEAEQAARAKAAEREQTALTKMSELDDKRREALKKEGRQYAEKTRQAIAKKAVDGGDVDGEVLYNELLTAGVDKETAAELTGFQDGWFWDSWTDKNEDIEWNKIKEVLAKTYITNSFDPEDRPVPVDNMDKLVQAYPDADRDGLMRIAQRVQKGDITTTEAANEAESLNRSGNNKAESLNQPTELEDRDIITEYIKKAEGFSEKPYDDKGGRSIGYGFHNTGLESITEDEANSKINDYIDDKVKAARILIPNFDKFNLETRKNIVSSFYRGGLSGSSKTIQLINAERYEDAADEFLDNEEYRNPNTAAGVKKRMEAVADALRNQQPVR